MIKYFTILLNFIFNLKEIMYIFNNMEINKPLSVSEFCLKIKDIIPTKKFIVSGEVNQLKNSHGHLYFTFKDSENCINSTIWKNKVETLQINISEGDKITLEGRLDFYSTGGKLNFIVDKVVANDGIGDLLKKYQKIKDDFTKKGYFDKANKKILGPNIKNILLLTSETGAAYHDFLYGLENANSNVSIDLIDVIVQGVDCPKNICNKLNKIKNSDKKYDLVVITRGGGSFQDLFGFSQPELIETLYDFNLPTLSAIGHQIDNPLSDLVCDYSTPTPSLAAQFIVDYNKNYLKQYQKILKDYTNNITLLLLTEMEKINKLLDKLNKKRVKFESDNKQLLINELNSMLRRLDFLGSKLNIYETNNIILNGNGKLLSTSEDLINYNGKHMEIIWNGVIVKVKVESISRI